MRLSKRRRDGRRKREEEDIFSKLQNVQKLEKKTYYNISYFRRSSSH
jgi:hypothetical protein